MKKLFSVLIAAVMVFSMIPFTVSAATYWENVTDAWANLDQIWDDNNTMIFNCEGSNYNPVVTVTTGSTTAVKFYGWFAYTSDIESYGYSINGGTAVYDVSFRGDNASDLTTHTGKPYARRFIINVPISSLAKGTHTIVAYAKSNGLEISMATLTLTISSRTESVPSLTDTSILASMSSDFQDARFTEGYSLIDNAGVNAGGTNLFRNHWTPIDGAGDPSNDVIVLESGGNKYATFSGFTDVRADYRWQGGYSFNTLVKGYDAGYGLGIHLNFSSEEGNTNGHYLFEYNALGAKMCGNNGIYVAITGANTVRLIIYTYDHSMSPDNIDWGQYVNCVYADFTIDGVDFANSLVAFNAKDGGTGRIELSFAGTKFATVKYSNDGLYDDDADSPFFERYYKSASIVDTAGETLVSTDAALISYYKTVGFGTRAATIGIDNVWLATYTAPAAVVGVTMPTDITVDAGATLTYPIMLSGDAEIISMRASVQYDTALTFVGYSLGTIITNMDTAATTVNDDGAGTVNMLIMNNDLADVAADGIIIKLRFSVPANAAAGTTYSFTFNGSPDDDTFCDLNENDYDYTVSGKGVATVNASEVEEPEVTDIELTDSSKYYFSGEYIVAVPATLSGDSLTAFLANLVDSANVTIYDASGNAITSTSAKVATGYTLKLTNTAGTVVKTYGIAVLGDHTGDGRVNATDFSALKANLKARNTSTLSAAQLKACNTSVFTGGTDSNVNATDASLLRSALISRAWY